MVSISKHAFCQFAFIFKTYTHSKYGVLGLTFNRHGFSILRVWSILLCFQGRWVSLDPARKCCRYGNRMFYFLWIVQFINASRTARESASYMYFKRILTRLPLIAKHVWNVVYGRGHQAGLPLTQDMLLFTLPGCYHFFLLFGAHGFFYDLIQRFAIF